MKATYRILRGFGIIGAIWIIVSLISGYLNFNGQMRTIPLSEEIEFGFWIRYYTGIIPFGLFALILLLPYGVLPKAVITACGALLCIALLYVGWLFIRPFAGNGVVHLDAMSVAAWWTLLAYFALVCSQLVALFWRFKNPDECFWNIRTR